MSSALVDTSVWIHHFRKRNQGLIALLESDAVLVRPMIVVEIGCGTPPSRASTLSDLATLKQAQQPSLFEAMDFIERENLYGQGCGIVGTQSFSQKA